MKYFLLAAALLAEKAQGLGDFPVCDTWIDATWGTRSYACPQAAVDRDPSYCCAEFERKDIKSTKVYYCMSYTDRIIWGTGYEDINRVDSNGNTLKYSWSCQSPDGKVKPTDPSLIQ